jgi:hypothetical protein
MTEMDWVGAHYVLREAEKDPTSRHTMDVVFSFMPSDWSATGAEIVDTVDQARADAVIDEALKDAGVERGSTYRSFVSGAGRGASWWAIGLWIGTVAYVGPPLVNAWFDLARNTASLWQRLRRTNRTPALSRGALVALCTLDLKGRTSSELDGVVLISATDLGERDITHSGGRDALVILFASQERAWVYLVDYEGHVLHFGEMGPLRRGVALQGGLDFGDVEPTYPMLLDDEAEPGRKGPPA